MSHNDVGLSIKVHVPHGQIYSLKNLTLRVGQSPHSVFNKFWFIIVGVLNNGNRRSIAIFHIPENSRVIVAKRDPSPHLNGIVRALFHYKGHPTLGLHPVDGLNSSYGILYTVIKHLSQLLLTSLQLGIVNTVVIGVVARKDRKSTRL